MFEHVFISFYVIQVNTRVATSAPAPLFGGAHLFEHSCNGWAFAFFVLAIAFLNPIWAFSSLFLPGAIPVALLWGFGFLAAGPGVLEWALGSTVASGFRRMELTICLRLRSVVVAFHTCAAFVDTFRP